MGCGLCTPRKKSHGLTHRTCFNIFQWQKNFLTSFFPFTFMQGFGTQHRDLIRIMVSRHEVDMNEIKGYYKKMYGISLCQAIMVSFLSGDVWNTGLVNYFGSSVEVCKFFCFSVTKSSWVTHCSWVTQVPHDRHCKGKVFVAKAIAMFVPRVSEYRLIVFLCWGREKVHWQKSGDDYTKTSVGDGWCNCLLAFNTWGNPRNT